MGYRLLGKGLVFLIVVLFLVISVFQSSGETTSDCINGNILYVGGIGDGNYTNIQDAINAALDGDTIFVYSGVYYENIVINKTIKLIGKNKDNTIIDGSGHNDVIFVSADRVNISWFTIQNSGNGYSGISLTDYSDYNIISDNIISKNWYGITFYYSSKNTISGNTISDNSNGISLGYFCNNNSILSNTISNNFYYGIYIHVSNDNNFFYFNSFIKNGQNAHDEGYNSWDNEWNGNYWSDYEEIYPHARKIWLKGIWSTPYDIPGENNRDRYPLIKPYVGSKGMTANIKYTPHLKRIFEQFMIIEQELSSDGRFSKCLNKHMGFIWW